MNRSTTSHYLLISLFTLITFLGIACIISLYFMTDLQNASSLHSGVYSNVMLFKSLVSVIVFALVGVSKVSLMAALGLFIYLGVQRFHNKPISKEYLFIAILCGAMSLTSGIHTYINQGTIIKPAVDKAIETLHPTTNLRS